MKYQSSIKYTQKMYRSQTNKQYLHANSEKAFNIST